MTWAEWMLFAAWCALFAIGVLAAIWRIFEMRDLERREDLEWSRVMAEIEKKYMAMDQPQPPFEEAKE